MKGNIHNFLMLTGAIIDHEDADRLRWCYVGGFQSQVNVQPTPGIEGDFAGYGPRRMVLAGPGGLTAGPAGCTVGRFAWWGGATDPDGTPSDIQSSFWGQQFLGAATPNQPVGFIHREQQALITTFLADASMVIPPGLGVTAMNEGDFWVLNRGVVTAIPGMKAYARFTDGAVQFNNPGTPITAASISQATITPALATFTGSIAGNILTVTALTSGTLTPGMTLSGSGGSATIATNTTITSQVSGSAGAVGVYTVNIAGQTVPGSTGTGPITINGSVGLLNVTGLASGTLGVGQILSGTGGGGVAANTTITASNTNNPGLGLTGAGGTGTYYVNPSSTVTAASMSAQGNIETKWFAASTGAVGEPVKMTSQPYG